MVARAQEQLARLNLHLPATRKVQGLSTAQQQLVEIAKALAHDAKLLILDEPTAALGGAETEALFEQVRKLRAEGVGIIYISHRMEEIRKITDRIVVLRDGERVADFPDSQIPVRTVVESMVGRSLERMFPPIPEPQPRTVLEVRGLTGANGAFRNASFSVSEGEILGIAGLVGAGRTELVRAIAGADPISEGTIWLDGGELHLTSPADAIAEGIVMVPEDRKLQGVVVEHAIGENIIYSNLDKVGRKGWITRSAVRNFADGAIKKFGVKGRAGQPASNLSGGNQQKVVIAKWLARGPRVVILDEPTRGIDVGARSGIYDIIVGLAKEGVAVIVVSSDLEEVLGVSNRIVVLAQGNQAGILPREKANDVAVMELATT
jgi:ribose transport system ATP-binding protein